MNLYNHSNENIPEDDSPEDDSGKETPRLPEDMTSTNLGDTQITPRRAGKNPGAGGADALDFSVPFSETDDTPHHAETVRRSEVFPGTPTNVLDKEYTRLTRSGKLAFSEDLKLERMLGAGGQGAVYLSHRSGVDRFRVPVAFKFFSPSQFESAEQYLSSMAHHAKVAAIVNEIQQENLVNVHNWREVNGIRLMEMEWVDGFDLQQLMTYDMYDWLFEHTPAQLWDTLTDVVFTRGITRPRLKSGIVVKIIRDCLNALHALHEHEIIHSDIKCSNIMLKRTGSAKIIDIGGAFLISDHRIPEAFTLRYAAPEVLYPQRNELVSVQSDLASLGYVMIELLAGCHLFAEVSQGQGRVMELVRAKYDLIDRLPEILPPEVSKNAKLMNFCTKLVHPDLSQRFPGAQDAILNIDGAAELHRQLILGGLASEYDFDIRSWLGALEAWEGIPMRKP